MGEKSKLICIKQCDNCGNDVEIRHKKRLEHKNIFCSKKCEGEYRSKQVKNNCECCVCGKKFHRRESHINGYTVCSTECDKTMKSILMTGEGNHQYGLKGNLNASWKSDEKITNYGYKKIRCLEHPLRDCEDFVFEHRLIAEKYLLTDDNSIEINGVKYLNPEFEVHHINENKLDNRVENLIVLTKSEHQKLHWSKRLFADNGNTDNERSGGFGSTGR